MTKLLLTMFKLWTNCLVNWFLHELNVRTLNYYWWQMWMLNLIVLMIENIILLSQFWIKTNKPAMFYQPMWLRFSIEWGKTLVPLDESCDWHALESCEVESSCNWATCRMVSRHISGLGLSFSAAEFWKGIAFGLLLTPNLLAHPT